MVQEVSGWRGVVVELWLVGRRFVVGVQGGLGRAQEYGFQVKLTIHSSFGLSFPMQGIIADSNVHHFSQGLRFPKDRDFILELLRQAIIELEM